MRRYEDHLLVSLKATDDRPGSLSLAIVPGKLSDIEIMKYIHTVEGTMTSRWRYYFTTPRMKDVSRTGSTFHQMNL
jgi:hypothetical protein